MMHVTNIRRRLLQSLRYFLGPSVFFIPVNIVRLLNCLISLYIRKFYSRDLLFIAMEGIIKAYRLYVCGSCH